MLFLIAKKAVGILGNVGTEISSLWKSNWLAKYSSGLWGPVLYSFECSLFPLKLQNEVTVMQIRCTEVVS